MFSQKLLRSLFERPARLSQSHDALRRKTWFKPSLYAQSRRCGGFGGTLVRLDAAANKFALKAKSIFSSKL